MKCFKGPWSLGETDRILLAIEVEVALSQDSEEVALENKRSSNKTSEIAAPFTANTFPAFHEYEKKDHLSLLLYNKMFAGFLCLYHSHIRHSML